MDDIHASDGALTLRMLIHTLPTTVTTVIVELREVKKAERLANVICQQLKYGRF